MTSVLHQWMTWYVGLKALDQVAYVILSLSLGLVGFRAIRAIIEYVGSNS
ncbi:hypothetical protein [Burkholderia cepacia]|nr:hypothetical protein [Burkholderia cepacia]